MSKYLIIDGYNLLGVRQRTRPVAALQGEAGREELLRSLSVYRQQKGYHITVVFDGWKQLRGTEHREHRSGLEVVYTRRGELADHVIQRMVRHFGSDCVVVSSDHEIVNCARSHGAFVMQSQEFLTKLEFVHISRSSPAIKGEDKDENIIENRRDKKGNPRRLPKALRKRNQRLKRF